MIASLRGALQRVAEGEVLVDVAGVGYRVFVPLSTQRELPVDGAAVRLRIVTVVREDDLSLYGFASDGEEQLFRLLQGVTGVGPRLALKILSGVTPEVLRRALAAGDTATLCGVSGVGKKLAQRLAMELRDKVGPVLPAAGSPRAAADAPEKEALAALEALGYPAKTARRALDRAAREGVGVEDLIREALRILAPRK